jgi:hypothetical protein
MKTRDDPSRSGRKSMRSYHRDPGCERVIAGFRLRLSRRPLRRGPFSGFVIFQGFAGRKIFPPFLRRVGREPCGTTSGDAPSVIADFQREASS